MQTHEVRTEERFENLNFVEVTQVTTGRKKQETFCSFPFHPRDDVALAVA
jgi:hypothetical protein